MRNYARPGLGARRLSLRQKKFTNCSVDGVLIRGNKVIPGAQNALKRLNDERIPWMLLTNGGGKSEKQRVADLSRIIGIDVPVSHFMQSHTPFRDLTKAYKRVMVVGGDGDNCRHVAYGYGFNEVLMPIDFVARYPGIVPFHRYQKSDFDKWADLEANLEAPVDAILAFNDPRDANVDTQIVLDLLLSDGGRIGTRARGLQSKPSIPIHFANNDLLWANNYALPRFGQGAYKIIVDSLYQSMTGHALESTVIGKPYHLTYAYADKILTELAGGQLPAKIFMVGDNPASDIAGAVDYGWESILVRTGVYNDGTEPSAIPTSIQDDVTAAVAWGLDHAASS